jgi:class 3 adenylate cyclase
MARVPGGEMRRARALDWLLLATLLPAHLAIQGLALRSYLPHAGRWFPFSVTGAQGADGYPLVDRLNTRDVPLRVGDRVLSANDVDLRGLSRADAYRALTPLLVDGRPYRVEAERDGGRFEATVAPATMPGWGGKFLGSIPLVLAATFLLLKAPHWHLRRRFFVAAILISSYAPADVGQLPWVVAAVPIGLALALACAFELSEGARPLRPWQRALPWVLGSVQVAAVAVYFLGIVPAGLWPFRISWSLSGIIFLVVIGALIRAYRRSNALERRQLRWVFWGAVVALLPNALFGAAIAAGAPLDFVVWEPRFGAFYTAFPLGLVVSVVGYRALDIDRVISATAALTLLGVLLVAAASVAMPRLAAGATGILGLDPDSGQVAFSLALAACGVPVYRFLRPWLDQRLFAEEHALGERFAQLRGTLGDCRGVEPLVTRAGEGIDVLLHPESLVTYGRSGDAFAPLFVRGRAAPLAFERTSTLVQVLEAKGAPLFARAKGIAPFERAALETLGAEVVVPVLREGQLVAFTCLAGKRSGDIYTATDLERLGALAERCADVLARLDADAVASDARELQAALRRYVPGAVAEQVVRGQALAPGEREVTVLFVDLRGYTRLAEGLQPEDVFATLNEHTERVSSIVQQGGGTVVEFNGDGMMVVFGAPEPLLRKELHAVEAARRIVDSMPAALTVGVGIATGSAFVGSIRASDRFIWTAVGSTTNLASRLQSLTRELDAAIAIDAATRERAGYVCGDFVRHPDVAIRGRSGRSDVFTLPLAGPAALSA